MKKISNLAITITGLIMVLLMVSCDDVVYKSKDNYAVSKVPVISQENGKFNYYIPLEKREMTYPKSKLDSVRQIKWPPQSRINYTTLSKDSFRVEITSTKQLILYGMDSLKFIYPPEAKTHVPRGIWWKKTDIIPLSPKFWLVGRKDGVKRVYTPEGKVVPVFLSEKILRTGTESPLSTDTLH